MTTQLRYLGTMKRKVKLADAPGYDGQPVEIILNEFGPENKILTMSDAAAQVVEALYPGLFERLTYTLPLDTPVETAGPGTETTDPPPKNRR